MRASVVKSHMFESANHDTTLYLLLYLYLTAAICRSLVLHAILQDIHSSMWMMCLKLHQYDKLCHAERYRVDTSLYQFIDSDWSTVSVFLCRPDTNTFLVVQESHLHAGQYCAQHHSNVHMHRFGMQSMLHKAMMRGAHASGVCPLSCTIAMPLKQTHCLVAPKPLQMQHASWTEMHNLDKLTSHMCNSAQLMLQSSVVPSASPPG